MEHKKLTEEDLMKIITPQGSLGLLALGDVGLRAWRKAKQKSNLKNGNEEKE